MSYRHPPYSLDLAPYDFWLFPNLRGCRYETIIYLLSKLKNTSGPVSIHLKRPEGSSLMRHTRPSRAVDNTASRNETQQVVRCTKHGDLAVVDSNPKAPFSKATTPRCRGGSYSFLWKCNTLTLIPTL